MKNEKLQWHQAFSAALRIILGDEMQYLGDFIPMQFLYLPKGGKVHTDVTEEMLSYIDVLVDGEFVQEKKDITLKFRGSSNQRVLKLENGKVVEHLFDS